MGQIIKQSSNKTTKSVLGGFVESAFFVRLLLKSSPQIANGLWCQYLWCCGHSKLEAGEEVRERETPSQDASSGTCGVTVRGDQRL